MKEPGPGARSRTPEDVLRDPRLTDAQRADLLRRWAYDERQVAVAVDEGMPGPDPRLLGRILRALGALERPPARGGAPTAHHRGSARGG